MDRTVIEIPGNRIESPDSHPARLQEAAAAAAGVDESEVAATVYRNPDGTVNRIMVEIVGSFDPKSIEPALLAVRVETSANEIEEIKNQITADSSYLGEKLIQKIRQIESRLQALERK